MGAPDLHPSPETLTAYHRGELAPADAESVLEHLVTCRHCADLLLDLPSFLAVAAVAAEPAESADAADASPAAAAADSARIPPPPHASAASPRPSAPSPARRPWRSAASGRSWNPLAAAALFAGLAVVSTPLWLIARRLGTPPLPPATLDLSPADAPRGSSAPAAPGVLVHCQAASTTLVLRLARAQHDLRFRVELTAGASSALRPGTGSAGSPGMPGPPAAGDAAGVAASPAFTVVDSRTVVVVLARGQLAPGRYQLKVLDAAAPSAAPLGAYELEVADP